jgi:hypothetical protein
MATKTFVAMYQNEQLFLTANLPSILSMLGKEFDSNDFIKAFHLVYPNEYGDVLKKSKSLRQFHTWVARWFLNGLADQGCLTKVPKKSLRKAPLGHNHTRNQIWSNNSKS